MRLGPLLGLSVAAERPSTWFHFAAMESLASIACRLLSSAGPVGTKGVWSALVYDTLAAFSPRRAHCGAWPIPNGAGVCRTAPTFPIGQNGSSSSSTGSTALHLTFLNHAKSEYS